MHYPGTSRLTALALAGCTLLAMTMAATAQTTDQPERQKIVALYIPLADHYAGIVAYEKYSDAMTKADYHIKRMPSWPMLRAEFLAKNADLAYVISPLAMDMFAKNPTFRWVSLLHRDGNALAINELINDRVNLPADRLQRQPDRKVADAFAAMAEESGRASECAVPSLLATHTVVLYKYLKDHGKTLSLSAGTSGDVLAIPVAPPKSPDFIKVQNARGRPASFEQSLPWADIVETGQYGHVAWYSKDVLPWPEGHVECIAIAQDDTILNKGEALTEAIHYLHLAGQDIEEAREQGGDKLDEITAMIRKHIPEHSPEAIRQSLRLDLDVINYRHLNVDEKGLEQVMDLAVEGGILRQPIDITAFANHDFATEVTRQRSRPHDRALPASNTSAEERASNTAAATVPGESAETLWWLWGLVVLLAFAAGVVLTVAYARRAGKGQGRKHGPGVMVGRLGRTLTLWFLGLSLVPLLSVTYLAYQAAGEALEIEAEHLLGSLSHAKAKRVEDHFAQFFVDLESLTSDQANVEFLAHLAHTYADSGMELDKFVASVDYEVMVKERGPAIAKQRSIYRFYDVLLIDKSGNVLFTAAREGDLGTNIFQRDSGATHLAKACKTALVSGRPTFSDFERYAPSRHLNAGFVIAPLVDSEARKIGLVAIQLNLEEIVEFVKDEDEYEGDSYSYLLGPDMRLRTPLSIEYGNAPVLTPIQSGLTEAWSNHMELGPGQVCDAGVESYQSHAGLEVLGAHEHLDIAGVQYLMVTEQHEEHALAPARGLLSTVLWLAVATALLVGFAGITLARRIVGPVLQVAGAARRVAEGDLATTVDIKSNNEIGDLGQAINRMTAALRNSAQANRQAQWLRDGQTQILEAMRGSQELSEICNNLAACLTRYLGCEAGLLYVPDRNGDLVRQGAFAGPADGEGGARFKAGEGLVGQVARDKRALELTTLPEDYMRIGSGLGEASPGALIVHPLESSGRVQGVLEIASLTALPTAHKELLSLVAENVAIGISAVKDQQRVHDLLDESQRQAEELQAQQEELKVANEELEEQTRHLQDSESRLKAQQEEMAVTNEELAERNGQLQTQKRQVEQAGKLLEQRADELAQASRYKSEFLANMSHELRTPLNSLLLLSQWLAENKDGNLSEEQVESAQVIYAGGSDLLNLINEILDLARIESGRLEARMDEVALVDLAASARQALGPLAEAKKLELEVLVKPDGPKSIVTDRKRLHQIIKNLGSNAIKFTGKGGVTITLGRADENVHLVRSGLTPDKALRISVKDTGIGIPQEKHTVIFDAFQQADGGTTREFGGTGLGLSISRELAELLGGEIQLASEPGKGAEFTLYLPLVGPTNTAKESTGESPTSKRTPKTPTKSGLPESKEPVPSLVPPVPDDRDELTEEESLILVVEDDPNFAKVILAFCHDRGFKCIVAANGEAGLEMAGTHLPDGIILDLRLPGMDGWSVLSALKEDTTTRHIPVHIISAEDGTTEARRKGAIGHITKPVDKDSLAQAFDLLEQTAQQLPRKVLLVEDDAEIRLAVKNLIGNGDVTLEEVGDGKGALAAMRATDYGCLILDLGLPDMSGYELLTKATSEELQLPPVIIYTSRDLSVEEEQQLMEHAESIVIKDVRSQERLLDEVSLFLHRNVSRLPEKKKQIIRALHETDDLLTGKTVLVVEDDMRTSFAVARLLTEKGMIPFKAANGKQALKLLEENPGLDLVLMDIMMPVMDGYEAIRRMRTQEMHRKLPIIALTAKAMPEDRQKCIDAGANDYLPKPVDPERLLSMMRVWLYR